jgi:hypothetical protein
VGRMDLLAVMLDAGMVSYVIITMERPLKQWFATTAPMASKTRSYTHFSGHGFIAMMTKHLNFSLNSDFSIIEQFENIKSGNFDISLAKK